MGFATALDRVMQARVPVVGYDARLWRWPDR